MKELFEKFDIDNYNDQDIKQIFLNENSKSDVYLTFKWTKDRRLVFYKLHVKYSNTTVDLLEDHSVNTKEGSKTFLIGSFDNNTELEISYSIMGLVEIPKIVTLLSQNNPDVAYQASPKGPQKTNKIESGIPFDETIKHKIQ